MDDLGAWTEVLDIVQTAEGRAVALAERDGTLELVGDDGEIRPVGTRPAQTASAALSPNAESFVLEVGDSVWYYSGGTLAPTGIVVPGILEALAVTDDGLVLLADRTRGPWAADARLSVELGAVCNGSVGTAAFVVDPRDDRVLCLQGPTIMIDDLDQLRPVAIGSAPVEPTTRVTSDGPLAAVGLIEGLIRIDRAGGTSFVLDPSGISLGDGYQPPAEISDADFFATGTLIGASGIPTTVAATADGSTFAIGFDDGRLIEVDLTQSGSMARVGVWQLPDRSPVSAIAWSEDLDTITASTDAGTVWERSSCAGCFSQDLLYERIAERAWLCYEKGDIDSLGRTARELFALAECETRWRDAS